MRARAPRRRVVTLSAVLALVAGGLVALLPAGPAGAATVYVVTNSTDPGAGTATNCTAPTPGSCALRDAFAAANALAGDAEIDVNLPASTVITIATQLLYTGGAGGTHALALVGNGVSVTLAASSDTINASAGTSLSIDGMTLTSGFTAVASSIPVTVTNSHLIATVTTVTTSAQGIINTSGSTITLLNSTIVASQSGAGNGTAVAIFGSPGNVSVTNSTITATGAPGQNSTGIQALAGGSATVTLVGSSITAVSSGAGSGTGITAASGVSVTNSQIQVGGIGGTGINSGGSVTMVGSTESGAGGNGITSTGGAATVAITNSTITGNASSGVVAVNNVVLVYATIVGNASVPVTNNISARILTSFGSVVAKALGAGSANCSFLTPTTSNGYNFSDDANGSTGCKFSAPTDRTGATNDPLLGALGANGGPTPTMLPASTSPLIDAIPLTHCADDGAAFITTDQRAFARPALTGCDIGAVEVQTIVARFTG